MREEIYQQGTVEFYQELQRLFGVLEEEEESAED